MWKLLKGYWDIFGGIIIGILMAFLAKFQLYGIQVCYSVIILILVCIGIFRIIKQTVDKSKGKKRQHNLIDTMVDVQPSVKAISISQNPTKDGEALGHLVIKLWEGLKGIMNKFKKLFDKFKGIVLAIALGILTAVEYYGGYIDGLFGDKLTIYGVKIIPLITLSAAIMVGIISNGWTKEQNEKIKALFSKSSTNELVQAEIKKTIKENTVKLFESNKALSTKETELENLKSEHESLSNTLQAKKEMCAMTPKLATEEDVRIAQSYVNECANKIASKMNEIDAVKETIEMLTTTITALKSKLYGG